eukprot:5500894-Alexandrium_andersonii.AAC.1
MCIRDRHTCVHAHAGVQERKRAHTCMQATPHASAEVRPYKDQRPDFPRKADTGQSAPKHAMAH